MNDTGFLLSVIMPAHNEGQGICSAVLTVHNLLRDHGIVHEIIVVDDGSTDDTFANMEITARAVPGTIALRLSRNFGKEAALLAGLHRARGEAVVTMDSDLQHPPRLIPEMVKAWRDGAMVVNGVKRSRSVDTWRARFRALAYARFTRALGGMDLSNSSDFKLLDRKVVNEIRSLPERRRLYRGLVQWIGFKQVSLTFDVAPRNAGTTKFSLRSLASVGTAGMITFTNAPLRVVTALGMLTLALGLLVTAEALVSYFRGTAAPGFMTSIIVELLIGSFIMISLGIIGEYIAKIYEEVKRRPTFVVATETVAPIPAPPFSVAPEALPPAPLVTGEHATHATGR